MFMEKFLADLEKRLPVLSPVLPPLARLIGETIDLFRNDGTLFLAGNGGSAADAEHICTELLKGFKSLRRLSDDDIQKLKDAGDENSRLGESLQYGLRTISLLSHPAFHTAFGNDVDADLSFAQQLWALGRAGDMFIGISTSGNAYNILHTLIAARAKNIRTVLITGNRKGVCEEFADLVIAVPESETYRIQELQLPIYHTFCLAVEAAFFEQF